MRRFRLHPHAHLCRSCLRPSSRPSRSPAQVPAATTAALQQIFASRQYAPERFGPARWIEDGAAYTTLERSAATKGGFDIVRYDSKTGARSILVAAAALVPAGDTTPLAIDDYTWSPDARQLMIFTNTQQVWRQNTRGDYWVLDRASGALRQLGGAGRAGLHDDVRQVLAPGRPRGLRPQGRHLRRAAGRRRRSPGSPPAPTRCTSTA